MIRANFRLMDPSGYSLHNPFAAGVIGRHMLKSHTRSLGCRMRVTISAVKSLPESFLIDSGMPPPQ